VGRLVLVATPIGNLGDLSPRAVAALTNADVIVCEDTRHSGRLLKHAGIAHKTMLVANDHTEASCSARVVELLDGGATVAVITDAGTPGISDPGERLVGAAVAAGHDVSVVPGPVAAIAALVVSGLATERFVMEGFLPRSGRERRDRLADVARQSRTVILYEAPHRLARTLADLVGACGPDRRVAIARELTKLHEEIWRGTLAEACERAATRDPIGEHVVMLAGAPPPDPPTDAAVVAAVGAALSAGASPRDAAAAVAATLGVPRRQVYDIAIGHPGRPAGRTKSRR
jgi:16S rRNA (cytidine1402-2'-O)-methyltransferase